MSAYQDKDQVVKFYFGNAMKDLAAVLPKEDPRFEPKSSGSIAQVEQALSSVESTLEQLKHANRELSFLVQDLGRMIKKI
jgi:predicted RNase H-like nuclease (RuvC/YqgF family)